MAPRTSYFARERTCIDQSLEIGKQTKVWHFSHILGNGFSKCCNIGLESLLAPEALPGHRLIYNQYNTPRVKRRDGLKKHLSDAKIGTEVYSFVPMRECFAYMGCGAEDCTESNRAALETPPYPKLYRIVPPATPAGPGLHCSLLSLP